MQGEEGQGRMLGERSKMEGVECKGEGGGGWGRG